MKQSLENPKNDLGDQNSKMTLLELRQKLQLLESQKINLDNEILQTKREIEKLSPFLKEQKIELFKSLFIDRTFKIRKWNTYLVLF